MFRLSHRGASSKEPACQCRACKKGGFDPRAGKVPWRRAWQLTSVFLLGESHGQRSLVLLRPRDRKELDTTVQLNSNNDRSYSRRGCLWTEEAEENILTLTPLVPTPATCHPPVVLGRRSLKATCFSTPSRSFSPWLGTCADSEVTCARFHLGPLRVTRFLFGSRTSRAHQLITVTSLSTAPSPTLKQRKPHQNGPARLGVSQRCDGWPEWGPPSGGDSGETPDPTGPVLSALLSEADPKAWDGKTHGSHF